MNEREQARRYVETIFGEREGEGFACLAAGFGGHFTESGRYEFQSFAEDYFEMPGGRDRLIEKALELAPKADVYTCPLLRAERSRKQGTALAGRFIWADVDELGPELEGYEAALVGPGGLVVSSGRGRHPYLLLPEDLEPAELESWNRRLAARLGADAGWSETKLLRLPGTLNHKGRDEPYPVGLLDGARAPRDWTLAELDTLLPEVPAYASGDGEPITPEERAELPARVAARLDEEEGEHPGKQSYAFVALCLEEGLTDGEALAAGLRHRVTTDKFKHRAARELERAIRKLRAEAPEEPATAPEPPPLDIPLAELLDRVTAFIRRFVVLNDAQLTAVSLWAGHTHGFQASRRTPYLTITSAEAESGKTRLLEVLELLVACPWLTERTSTAALVRKIAAQTPTLLLDESDTAFSADKEYAQALRGILNAGYRRGGHADICVKQGGDWIVKGFPVFCPKAIAGIGVLPTTVASRAIPIRLQRRAPSEHVEDFFEEELEEEAGALRSTLAAVAEAHAAELEQARRPSLPVGIRDRAAECWRPLLALADLAGEDWGERARAAAVELAMGTSGDAGTSKGIRLLADIRAVFEEYQADKITSADLVDALKAREESPWAEWSRGRGLSKTALAKLLAEYRIRPRTIRVNDGTAKGYARALFKDAWARYLPTEGAPNVTPAHPAIHAGLSADPNRNTIPDVTDGQEAANPHEHNDVTAVTSGSAGMSAEGPEQLPFTGSEPGVEPDDEQRGEPDDIPY